jgi:hypothetical protein
MQDMHKYTYRLVFHTKRTWDFKYKKNFDFSHENNLFKKNSLLSSFNELKNKFKICTFYKGIYRYYAENLRRSFFYYYLPIIDLYYEGDELKMKFHEFKIWYKPKAFDPEGMPNPTNKVSKNSISGTINRLKALFDGTKHITPKSFIEMKSGVNDNREQNEKDFDIFYENRDLYKNEIEYLDKTSNERARARKKGYNMKIFQNSRIDLFHEKLLDHVKDDPDFEEFK